MTVLFENKALKIEPRSQDLAIAQQHDCGDRAWQGAVISIVYLKSDSTIRFSS
ncbi:hypothetical protein [Chroococcidiopsis sp. CCALA 051]|uniref:hypothetical protein n=1 Tax=Chroococcidiopsis sp. CCALA 051 TaxID=869949 RepID=UPI001E54CA7C|nr:hypothetical protein [Chroococcidiopsis sp. CCALA 051]